MTRLFAALSAGILVTLSLAASAAEAEETPDYAGMTLSGDWGGKRSTAWQNGWSWNSTLKVDALSQRNGTNPGGGVMSNLDLRLTGDLAKIAGWDGATAYLQILDDRGNRINEQHTGSLMGVSNIEVSKPLTTLFQAWIQQNFLADRFSVLVGLYPFDSEFSTVDSASQLIHPSFGASAELSMTQGPSIFNRSSFGLRAKWQSEDRTRYAMAALLDGFPASDPEHPTFAPTRLTGGHGSFAIAEMGLRPDERGHLFEPSWPAKELPATQEASAQKYAGISKYALGIWRYSQRAPDQFDVDANGDPLQTRSQGAYLLAERTLFGLGSAGRDLTAFTRYSFSDGDSTPLDKALNLGIRLRGPLASRPDDTLSIGWTRSRLAGKYCAAQAAAGMTTANHEEVWEIAWHAAITPWFAIQPELLSIRNPGGDASAPRTTIIGARIEIEI